MFAAIKLQKACKITHFLSLFSTVTLAVFSPMWVSGLKHQGEHFTCLVCKQNLDIPDALLQRNIFSHNDLMGFTHESRQFVISWRIVVDVEMFFGSVLQFVVIYSTPA